tara:strand:- start:1076 stop:1345 length:270 start_codon:yes stop_codon:yes gene_type:complete
MTLVNDLVAEVFWNLEHPLNQHLGLESATKADVRQAVIDNWEKLEAVGWVSAPHLEPERPSSTGQGLAGGVEAGYIRRDGPVEKIAGCE